MGWLAAAPAHQQCQTYGSAHSLVLNGKKITWARWQEEVLGQLVWVCSFGDGADGGGLGDGEPGAGHTSMRGETH